MTSATKYIAEGLPRLPDWVPPAGDLNDSADASRSKQEIASPTLPLPVPYGRDRVYGKIAAVSVNDAAGYFYLLFAFCVPCEAVEKLYVDGVDINDASDGLLANGGSVEVYASDWSSAGQTTNASAIMQEAIAGYNDTPQACWAALRIPKAYARAFPRVEALLRGVRVYDPRTDETVYSDNPVLCAADMAVQCGCGVDWGSVEVAADWNDELLGGKKRRTIGITLVEPRSPEEWMKVWRVYTGCFITWEAGVIRFIPDKAETLPDDLTAWLTADDILADSIRVRRKSPLDLPTVVIVEYRDSSNDDEWRTARAVYDTGELDSRVSRIQLPGIHEYAQAYREAKERQKKLNKDVSVDLTVFDEGLEYQIGAIVRVTHPIGVDGYFRVVGLNNDDGRWALTLTEYDAAVYPSDVPDPPAFFSPELGSPNSPAVFNPPTLLELGAPVERTVQYLEQGGEPADQSKYGRWHALSKDGTTAVVGERAPFEDLELPLPPTADSDQNVWLGAALSGDATVAAFCWKEDVLDGAEQLKLRICSGVRLQDAKDITLPLYGSPASSKVAVSFSGGVVVVTSQFDSSVFNLVNTGRILTYFGEDWSETRELIPWHRVDDSKYGTAVAISHSGAEILVASNLGQALVFHGDTWSDVADLQTSGFNGATGFAISDAQISGDGKVVTCESSVFTGAGWGTKITPALGDYSMAPNYDGSVLAVVKYASGVLLLSGVNYATSTVVSVEESWHPVSMSPDALRVATQRNGTPWRGYEFEYPWPAIAPRVYARPVDEYIKCYSGGLDRVLLYDSTDQKFFVRNWFDRPVSKLYVFTDDDAFAEPAKVIYLDSVLQDSKYSNPLAISDNGSTIVVGLDAISPYGRVVAYHGENWSTKTVLTTPTPVGGYSGAAVAISGDGAVIATSNRWVDSGDSYGSVTLLYGAGWATSLTLEQPVEAANTEFGYSIALNKNGSVLLVSEPELGPHGIVHIFYGLTWTSRVELAPYDVPTATAHFGYVLGINDSGTLVGVISDELAGTKHGALYLFSGANWSEATKLSNEPNSTIMSAYRNLAISGVGDAVFVGAALGSETTAHVLRYEQVEGAWEIVTRYSAEDVYPDTGVSRAYYGYFGVSVNRDGSKILAGGDYFNDLKVALVSFTQGAGVVAAASTVRILGGTGLSGGGDLTQDRTIVLDFSGLPEESDLDPSADSTAIFDASVNAHRQAFLINLPGTKATISTAAADYTLSATDLYVRMTSAVAANCTVPDNVAAPIPVGRMISVRQVGAGQVTFVAGPGVTVNTSSTLVMRTQGSTVTLIKVGINEWDLVGDML